METFLYGRQRRSQRWWERIYIWIKGRVDGPSFTSWIFLIWQWFSFRINVINVSEHQFSTAEIECSMRGRMAIYRIFLNISRTFYFSGCSVSYFSFFSVSSLSRRRRSGTAADEQCYVETQLILLAPPPQQAKTRFLHQHNLTINNPENIAVRLHFTKDTNPNIPVQPIPI